VYGQINIGLDRVMNENIISYLLLFFMSAAADVMVAVMFDVIVGGNEGRGGGGGSTCAFAFAFALEEDV
jgi:hypothetical protein